MAGIMDWRQRLAVLKKHLQDVEQKCDQAKQQFRHLKHVPRDLEKMSLSEAPSALSQSFKALRQRQAIVQPFEGEDRDWFPNLTFERLLLDSCGKPRSTETGSTQLRRGILCAADVLKEFHELQGGRERSCGDKVAFLRAYHKDVNVPLDHKDLIFLIATVDVSLTVMCDALLRWTTEPEGEEDDFHWMQASLLTLQYTQRKSRKVHATIESAVLGLECNMRLVRVRIARQRRIEEFAEQPQRAFGRRALVKVLNKAWEKDKGDEREGGRQRLIAEYFSAVGHAEGEPRKSGKGDRRGEVAKAKKQQETEEFDLEKGCFTQ